MFRRIIDIPGHLKKLEIAAAQADKHRAVLELGIAQIAATKSSNPKIQKLINVAKKHGPPLPVATSVQPVSKFL